MFLRTALKVGLLSFATLLIEGSASARDWAKDGWEFVSESDGIKVYRKIYPGSDVKGVAGEAVLDGSIGKVLFMMVDHKHKPDWINRFKEAHTVEEIPPSSNIQYSSFDLPFPATDRDFVFRNDFSVDEKLRGVVIDVKSVVDKRASERADLVRGEIVRGKYSLIPQGDKTLMQAEYLADPKGMIPTWLINFFQKEWPYKTLDAMRKQLKKPYIEEWSVYTKVLKPQLDALPPEAAAANPKLAVPAPASAPVPAAPPTAAPAANAQ
ncbi:MAG: hypothetical protein H7318_00835 [Oligoflexus sp.]|nr:hypothetical protein [Oligoflexus sp.]